MLHASTFKGIISETSFYAALGGNKKATNKIVKMPPNLLKNPQDIYEFSIVTKLNAQDGTTADVATTRLHKGLNTLHKALTNKGITVKAKSQINKALRSMDTLV